MTTADAPAIAEPAPESAVLGPEVAPDPVEESAPPTPTRARARFATLSASHAVIDIFPILFSTLLWPLRERLALSDAQVTWIIIATPIFSGLLQPFFAWLSDKHDTRLCGPLGLAIGATCIGSIGLAQTFWQLVALQIVGVIATGFYHPIATAQAGQSGSRLFANGRAQAIGLFIGAGMVGHAIGAWLGPLINQRFGMEHLLWLVPPSLVLAAVLHGVTRRMAHRRHDHAEVHAALSRAESARRWRAVAVLGAQNALRFIVQVGLLVVMFNVWAKSKLVQDVAAGALALNEKELAAASAVESGKLATALAIGMAAGVLALGRLVRRGSERGPLLWYSFVGAAAVGCFGLAGDALHDAGGFSIVAMLPLYALSAVATLGCFSTFPVATSLAQRLQPGHASLVTSIMMGLGWGLSALSAPLAVAFFGGVSIAEAPELEPWRINVAFFGFASLLVVAGLLTLLIPKDLVARAAEDH